MQGILELLTWGWVAVVIALIYFYWRYDEH